jgi:predicted RNase H-like HicB family nuclease
MGEARGTVPEGADYSVWLLQVDDGDPCLAVGGAGPQFEVRFALTGEVLPDRALVSKARTAIARHHARNVVVTAERDEDGLWCAQAILAPGIAAHGNGETRQAAVDDCNDALDLLIDELRADT